MIHLGRTDSQKGQRLTLKCTDCRRVLKIYHKQKKGSSLARIIVLNGSVHKTQKGNQRIYVKCKCGRKMIFENNSTIIKKYGWRRIE